MSSFKPQEALKLGLNVLIDSECEGCNFCEYPYTIQSIVSKDKHVLIEFNNDAEVWDYIDELTEEIKDHNETMGRDISILTNIYSQLPFFVCTDNLLSRDYQKDIGKYIYCKETSTPVYSGSYGDTPSLWVQKFYKIKQALFEKEQNLRQKLKKEKEHGNN